MELRVTYRRIPNMGDMLNVPLIKEVFGYDVKYSTKLSVLRAIGSGLGSLVAEQNAKSFYKLLYKPFLPKVHVWGTGFMNYAKSDKYFIVRKMEVAALRGRLSKERVERALDSELSCPLSDGGILASYLLKEKEEKRFKIGVIPHFRERQNPIFKKLADSYNDSLLIDVTQDPHIVIQQIAQCECIISTSLHGLILSDSLGVPNVHAVYSSLIKGDGFKFDDYYSGYGMEHLYIRLRDNDVPQIYDIVNNYAISHNQVEQKKREMIEAFPFPHQFKY